MVGGALGTARCGRLIEATSCGEVHLVGGASLPTLSVAAVVVVRAQSASRARRRDALDARATAVPAESA